MPRPLLRQLYCFRFGATYQYEKRFERDDKEKDRRKAREAMSDKIRMKMEFRQQVGSVAECVLNMRDAPASIDDSIESAKLL